ncbi:MAG: hypothetical protein HOP11_07830 [Saprospiraceae bacterium]|nr:hypothetical protein [Saprospiraceae bacterium]
MLRFIKFAKDALLAFPLTLIFLPFSRFFSFLYYYNKLVIWIWKNKGDVTYHDFYSPFRDYKKRYALYENILQEQKLKEESICYLEFGVASGASFKWWLEHNTNIDSHFYGFDTFEGLPEKWGSFDKGAMSYKIPEIDDSRAKFFKGLFQETLNPFIQSHEVNITSSARRIFHMDADLYSATIFSLSQLFPYLKKGDLIMFDEFSVAMHEFKAFDEFVSNFYIKLRPIAAVNNFYQICFIVE